MSGSTGRCSGTAALVSFSPARSPDETGQPRRRTKGNKKMERHLFLAFTFLKITKWVAISLGVYRANSRSEALKSVIGEYGDKFQFY